MSDAPDGVGDQGAIKDEAAPQTKSDQEKKQALDEFSKKTDGPISMRVHVHSPYQDYYDGLAFSVSAENATGPFDILPRHHNFISLLLPCDLTVRTVQEGDRKIRISGGLLHVKADQVVVFLDV